MRGRRSAVEGPAVDVDLFSREAVLDSRALFTEIRAAGPIVWLPRHRLWAMGRYEDVRRTLRDDQLFRSGRGVAANPIVNLLGRDTTLSSDDDTHERRRRVLMRSLGAKALGAAQERLEAQAERLVEELLGVDEFDAVKDFASRLPLGVVADLVGVPRKGEELLSWAGATFNVLGPLNRRGLRAGPTSLAMLFYAQRLGPRRVAPGSWAASVFEAHQRGELSRREAKAMVIDFIAPSLDTTILASAHMLWLLAHNPPAWQAIREDPSLIAAAVGESVRLSSPIRLFTRRVARDHELEGAKLRKGARVAVLFASANLDEAQFPNPDRFDLTRPQGGHLAWGNGPHTCVGLHLAKLEMQALLRAMVPRVREIGVGDPVALQNNTLQGFTRLPASFA